MSTADPAALPKVVMAESAACECVCVLESRVCRDGGEKSQASGILIQLHESILSTP